ncbi:Rad9-domain-containing protein [Trametes elegans]|nr:Rad9-domain-containing protein [Trametes elegans]
MQATIDSSGLKHLTRALACLSRFGEDLIIVATPETFALSATNQALSAYGRIKYARSFFSRYRVGDRAAIAEVEEVPTLTGQIVIKPLLQILKHRTIEKSCEKCEFVITDGASQEQRPDDEEEDTLESRLTVRLHCKHGVVKTHRLALNVAHHFMSPTLPDPAFESKIAIGPKAVKNMLEHFPFGRGGKTDPQLIWTFSQSEVQLRSLETAVDAKGRVNLTTELTISADEFDEYDIQISPLKIAFHLREFNATVAFAEASGLALEVRFTEPDAPVYIDVGGDMADTLFVIATSRIQTSTPDSSQAHPAPAPAAHAKGRKRPREDEWTRPAGAQPMKVVHRADRASIAREMNPAPEALGPRPSWAILTAAQPRYRGQEQFDEQGDAPPPGFGAPSQQPRRSAERVGERQREPLFLPGSQLSQLAPADEAAIIESGLGIEHMTAEELADMLEGDAEEVEFATQRNGVSGFGQLPSGEDADAEMDASAGAGQGQGRTEDEDWQIDDDDEMDSRNGGYGQQGDSFELVDDDIEMEPTQRSAGTKVRVHWSASYALYAVNNLCRRCSDRCSKTRQSPVPVHNWVCARMIHCVLGTTAD